MMTSAVFIALIGTLQFKATISASISYEPFKITVNENFNAQPGQVSTEFKSLEPGVVHQGANFYFKPKFSLPSSSIPHHIEALMSLIQQHHSCAKDATKVVFEKDKLMEILMPFLYPKEALSDTVMEEENNSEIVEPVSILFSEEPKRAIPELEVIPEAPVLLPLSFSGIPSIVEEEIQNEESVTLEESTGVLNEIIEVEPKPATIELELIPEGPVLPQFSSNDIRIVDEVNIEEPPLPQHTLVDVEAKPVTTELLLIPEAPMLPALSFNGMPSIVEEEVKKEESVILKDLTDMFPTKSAITVGPITEPIINYVEPKPKTSELLVIPEAPVLPPLPFNDIRTFVEKEMGKKESIILEESTGISQEPTIIEIAPISVTTELEVIPEAPVLPPLSFNGISASVEKEVKKEESIILEESTGESQEPTIIEVEPKPATPELVVIPEVPVLPPFSVNDIGTVEKVKIEKPKSLPMLELIDVDIEPKSATPELQVIPEAPILPPLSLNGIPTFVEEKLNREESVILEESTGALQEPIIIEVKPKPSTPESVIIPGKLQSLSFEDIHTFIEEEMKNKESMKLEGSTGESQEPTIIEIEPKPATPELEVIPEAPVLPPLSFKGIPDFVGEEVKKEESIILEESQEPTMIEIEPKPATPELEVIPEAPVLPPLSFKGIPDFVGEEVKKEESIILEESQEPTMIEIEPKPATPELEVILEAPVLPPLSFKGIPDFVGEEVKKEESIILEESQEPTMIEIEPKPATPELIVMPEAPVLPILSANDIRIVEEVKIEKPTTLPMPESIVVDIEPEPVTPESFAIPEAPVLPPLSFNGFPSFVEAEVKKEESVILEESTGVLQEPTIIEVEPKPTTSELVVIPKAPVLPPMSEMPFIEEIKSNESILLEESTGSIPEISASPTLESETEFVESFALENHIFPVATEEVKIEIPVLLEEPIEVFPPVRGISSGPTLQEPEITNSYVLKEVSQTNPEPAVVVRETFPPTIIRKPLNNLGVFSYAPFLSHLSNRAPKSKQVKFPKPASLERFLLKKHPISLPVTPFPKLSLNDMKSPILGNKNQFLYPTSYAHDVVEKRIAPNMAFKKNALPKRVKIYVRSNVPKGPSYL